MSWEKSEPLRVLVASGNEEKVGAVRDAMVEMFGAENVAVESEKVDRGMTCQPLTSDDTRRGAVAGAEILYKRHGDKYHLYVGVEGGVRCNFSAKYHLLDWMCFIGGDGRKSLAFDGCYPLPDVISKNLRHGMELGDACDQLFGTENLKQNGGITSVLSDGLYTRRSIYMGMAIRCMTGFPDFMERAKDRHEDQEQLLKYQKLLKYQEILRGCPSGPIGVALGSDSPVKIIATEDAFFQRYANQHFKDHPGEPYEMPIKPFDVDARLPKDFRPDSDEKIFNLALLREELADELSGGNCKFSVGIQGGYYVVEGMDMILDAVVVAQRAPDGGKIYGQAIGGAYTLSAEFSKELQKNSGDIGHASDVIWKTKNLKNGIGHDGRASRGYATRADKTAELIYLALNQIYGNNRKYYG